MSDTANLMIDTFRTAGTFDNPLPEKWTSLVYDTDGQVVASSGRKDTADESVDAVTALLAAA